MADTFVEPEKEQFRVHKALLCSRVPFFTMMFSGPVGDSQDHVAILPDRGPVAFGLFLEWLDASRYVPLDVTQHTVESGPFNDRISLYGLAEKTNLPCFMDYTIIALLTNYVMHHKIPSFSIITLAYQGASQGSLLRTFMAQCLQNISLSQTKHQDGRLLNSQR
jgi:hypothetical protein